MSDCARGTTRAPVLVRLVRTADPTRYTVFSNGPSTTASGVPRLCQPCGPCKRRTADTAVAHRMRADGLVGSAVRTNQTLASPSENPAPTAFLHPISEAHHGCYQSREARPEP